MFVIFENKSWKANNTNSPDYHEDLNLMSVLIVEDKKEPGPTKCDSTSIFDSENNAVVQDAACDESHDHEDVSKREAGVSLVISDDFLMSNDCEVVSKEEAGVSLVISDDFLSQNDSVVSDTLLTDKRAEGKAAAATSDVTVSSQVNMQKVEEISELQEKAEEVQCDYLDPVLETMQQEEEESRVAEKKCPLFYKQLGKEIGGGDLENILGVDSQCEGLAEVDSDKNSFQDVVESSEFLDTELKLGTQAVSESEEKSDNNEPGSEEEMLDDGTTNSERSEISFDVDSPDEIEDDYEEAESVSKRVRLDYRLQDFQDLGRYQKNNPGSFFDHSENAWFCSICQKFSKPGSSKKSWVDVGVYLKKQPGRKFKKHFGSSFHKTSVEIKLEFEKARYGKKDRTILKLLTSLSRTSEEQVIADNREIVKILFRTVHYQVKHLMSNATYTSLLQHIAECGSEALKQFIIKSPKNATYLSMKTFDKILVVLNTFTENPLLESLQKAAYFCVYHDETTDISNHSEAAVYVMFLHDEVYGEHYLGIINMAPLMGLTAENHYKATLKLFDEKGVNLKNAACSDLDGCSVNKGVHAGFKLYFKHHNPHHLHQSCNCHHLPLIPKKKITESRFKVVANADKLMLAIYVHFKNGSVRTAIFENSQIVLENTVLKLICPSATRWLSHEACFRRILIVYEPTVITLNQLYEDRDDIEALGFVMQLTDPTFVLTAMMLADMLGKFFLFPNNYALLFALLSIDSSVFIFYRSNEDIGSLATEVLKPS